MSSDVPAASCELAGAWGATGRDAELPDVKIYKKRKVPREGQGSDTASPCDYYENYASRRGAAKAAPITLDGQLCMGPE
jgi:hypothetical protein